MARRMADRVERSEPPRGPLQLHHLDAKTEISCIRCAHRTQTRVVATLDGDWSLLVDRGCYDVWLRELGIDPDAGDSSQPDPNQ
jgi:hypothetical protein